MPIVQTLPTARPTADRRAAITAAAEAYDRTHPEQPLPRSAVQLLLTMFPAEDEFRGTQELLRSAGGGGRNVSATLQILMEAGLLQRRRNGGRGPDSYRLVLP